MRFPDGAVRPAYNAQIVAAPKKGVIVSIDVADRRNDAGLAGPMVDDIARRYERRKGGERLVPMSAIKLPAICIAARS